MDDIITKAKYPNTYESQTMSLMDYMIKYFKETGGLA